jgi:hypothetical protein
VTDTGLQPTRKNISTKSMGIDKTLLFNFILEILSFYDKQINR